MFKLNLKIKQKYAKKFQQRKIVLQCILCFVHSLSPPSLSLP